MLVYAFSKKIGKLQKFLNHFNFLNLATQTYATLSGILREGSWAEIQDPRGLNQGDSHAMSKLISEYLFSTHQN